MRESPFIRVLKIDSPVNEITDITNFRFSKLTSGNFGYSFSSLDYD